MVEFKIKNGAKRPRFLLFNKRNVSLVLVAAFAVYVAVV